MQSSAVIPHHLDSHSLAPDAAAFPYPSSSTPMASHAPVVPPEVAEHIYALSRYPLEQVIHWLQHARVFNGTNEQPDFPAHTITPDSLSFHTQISPRVSVASSDPRYSRTSSIFTTPSSYRMSSASSRSSNSSFAPQISQVGTGRTPRPDACPGKYVCSHCDVRFKRNWDWKFHEETFHERWRRFDCNQCNQSFWSETKFNQHHRSAHGCQTCPGAGHAQEAEIRLRKRTAWGCGYCGATLLDWDTRCKHITQHIEAGTPKTSWKQTSVILGLLHQPKFADMWKAFVIERHGHELTNFCWARRETAELQEALEYSEEATDPAALVSRSYELGHVPARSGSQRDSTSASPSIPQVDVSAESSPPQVADSVAPPKIIESIEEGSAMQVQVSQPMDSAMEGYDQYLTVFSQPPVFESIHPHLLAQNHFFMGTRQQPPPRTDKELPALPPERSSEMMDHDPSPHPSYTQHLDGSGYENWSRLVTAVPQNNYFAH